MKRVAFVALVLFCVIFLLVSTLVSCPSYEYDVKKLKQCIPDLKKLVADNEDVFTEIRALSKRKSEIAYFSVNFTTNHPILKGNFKENDPNRQVDYLAFFDFFTHEEIALIRLFFSLSENEVGIVSFESDGTSFSVFPRKDRVRMELIYGEENDRYLKEQIGFSSYWEEILDNWYVVILAPPLP